MRIHPRIPISQLDDGYVKWTKALGVASWRLWRYEVTLFMSAISQNILASSHSPPNFDQSSCLDTSEAIIFRPDSSTKLNSVDNSGPEPHCPIIDVI